jgi:hypothetical protein
MIRTLFFPEVDGLIYNKMKRNKTPTCSCSCLHLCHDRPPGQECFNMENEVASIRNKEGYIYEKTHEISEFFMKYNIHV